VGAQQKEVSLTGKKLLLCEQCGDPKTRCIAVDLVGAGFGDWVLVSNAQVNVKAGAADNWADQWIVGIVDDEDVAQLKKEGVL
jgi:microcompartment protein CcmK/EutM